jgi:hypothetical protein
VSGSQEVRSLLADVVATRLPRPRGGRTGERWAALQRLGQQHDLSVAKLAESHFDAVEILAEGGRSPAGSELYGVWASASGGSGLTLLRHGNRLRLRGCQRFASGARLLDRALVAAVAEDGTGTLLVEVPLDDGGITVVPESWPAVGMAGTDSVELMVDLEVPADAVIGEPNWYLRRPGFWVGGMGVAAVWLGGARRVLAPLAERGRAPGASELILAHYGAAVTRVVGCEAFLSYGASAVDSAPDADHRALALMLRHTVERAATEIVDRVGLALGAAPLCLDPSHGRLVADLTVFIRQTHGDADMSRLARDLLSEGADRAGR